MWDNDPIFANVLRHEKVLDAFFRLPESIYPEDVQSAEALHAAFRRVFRCELARKLENLVLVWSVSRPYRHTDGERRKSTIVYIEKTSNSMASRWPIGSLAKLCQDYTLKAIADPNCMRALAISDRNFTFYQRLIMMHGPMHISWSTVTDLRAASQYRAKEARVWERRLICGYLKRHGCFPLKNQRR